LSGIVVNVDADRGKEWILILVKDWWKGVREKLV
jgi:hypothetical protein